MRIVKITLGVLLTAIVLLVGSCMSHPWFKSRFPWEDKPDPNQKPVLTNSRGETYLPGTPSWVPLVDDCMAAGGNRTDCSNNLPPDELAKLQRWEQRMRRSR
jgi:hypothetical protein